MILSQISRWRRSLSFTPSFWYFSVLTIILTVFSTALYLVVASSLAGDLDKALVLQAENVAESVFAFWRAERSSPGSSPGNWSNAPSNTIQEELAKGDSSAVFNRWADHTRRLETPQPLRILDRNGQPIAESPGFVRLEVGWPLAISPTRQMPNVYETFAVEGHPIRVLTHAVIEQGNVMYFVQAAESLSSLEEAVRRLGLWLVILVPVFLLMIAGIGWALAASSRRPIQRLMGQLQQFVAEQLHQHSQAPRGGDSVAQLSETFQDMLVKLEGSLRRLRQFGAAAAHEQRTALTVMKGELDVTLRKPRTAKEYRDLLERHLRSINDIAGATEELLRLAQWEASTHMEQQPVEFAELTRRVAEAFQPLADRKSIQLLCQAHDPLWVLAHPRLLERVFANVIDNAVKYTPSGGTVTVTAVLHEADARLSVRDTGPGIPPEQLETIFDRFFKRRTADDGGGPSSTGLGLGLCRWIIDSHHGRIHVDSSPDHGTTVTIALPHVSAPAPAFSPPRS